MKTGIHPVYHTITISCACGNSFQAGSTHEGDLRVEICAQCHPLYTGKSNLIDTAGRLDKFQARQQKAQSMQSDAQKRQQDRAIKEAAKAELEAQVEADKSKNKPKKA